MPGHPWTGRKTPVVGVSLIDTIDLGETRVDTPAPAKAASYLDWSDKGAASFARYMRSGWS